jgi:hypothetical protein
MPNDSRTTAFYISQGTVEQQSSTSPEGQSKNSVLHLPRDSRTTEFYISRGTVEQQRSTSPEGQTNGVGAIIHLPVDS